MKKLVIFFFTAILVLSLASCGEPGRFFITTRFSTPAVVRPPIPGEGYIWIEGDWFFNGNTYTWRDGYWSRPLPGYYWVPGEWKFRSQRWYWKPGHWRK